MLYKSILGYRRTDPLKCCTRLYIGLNANPKKQTSIIGFYGDECGRFERYCWMIWGEVFWDMFGRFGGDFERSLDNLG